MVQVSITKNNKIKNKDHTIVLFHLYYKMSSGHAFVRFHVYNMVSIGPSILG